MIEPVNRVGRWIAAFAIQAAGWSFAAGATLNDAISLDSFRHPRFSSQQSIEIVLTENRQTTALERENLESFDEHYGFPKSDRSLPARRVLRHRYIKSDSRIFYRRDLTPEVAGGADEEIQAHWFDGWLRESDGAIVKLRSGELRKVIRCLRVKPSFRFEDYGILEAWSGVRQRRPAQTSCLERILSSDFTERTEIVWEGRNAVELVAQKRTNQVLWTGTVVVYGQKPMRVGKLVWRADHFATPDAQNATPGQLIVVRCDYNAEAMLTGWTVERWSHRRRYVSRREWRPEPELNSMSTWRIESIGSPSDSELSEGIQTVRSWAEDPPESAEVHDPCESTDAKRVTELRWFHRMRLHHLFFALALGGLLAAAFRSIRAPSP